MMYIRDILPGVSATWLDGFDLVMDLLVFAKNMYVYGFFILPSSLKLNLSTFCYRLMTIIGGNGYIVATS